MMTLYGFAYNFPKNRKLSDKSFAKSSQMTGNKKQEQEEQPLIHS